MFNKIKAHLAILYMNITGNVKFLELFPKQFALCSG